MDKKGLNINRPLLSVRRFSSVSSQKNENRRNESYLAVRSAMESCKTGSTSKPLMNSGSVPFGWEHTPGRPKNETPSSVLKVPPPARFFKPRKVIKPECSKSGKKENSGPRYDDYGDSSGEVYMDALDTLSRGETSFRSCNASGVNGIGSNMKPSKFHSCSSASGVNGLGTNMKPSAFRSYSARGVNGYGSNMKPSAYLMADPRNFMLGRFLPAARAIAKDVPRRSFKENDVKKKPQEVKKLVHKDSFHNKVQHRYEPNFVQDVTHDKEEEQDDYDSDYEYQAHGKKSSRFCGLIPRFCSANSVHGMSMRASLPTAPTNKTLASTSTSSFRETVTEPAKSAAVLHRSMSSVSKSESTELANLEGSKLYNRLQGPWISADVSGSIQPTVSEQSDLSLKKKGLRFMEMLADKNTDEITATCSQDSILEKTLYVDTICVAESPKADPIPSFTKPQPSFNEPLESDMFADDPKHDMKASKCKDFDAEFELFDEDVKGKQKLQKAYETRLFQHPAPPPLPKSPSDSWLGRTLPSVSSKRVPMMWIPKYPSAYIVTNDPKHNDNISLQSPQEEMSAMPES